MLIHPSTGISRPSKAHANPPLGMYVNTRKPDKEVSAQTWKNSNSSNDADQDASRLPISFKRMNQGRAFTASSSGLSVPPTGARPASAAIPRSLPDAPPNLERTIAGSANNISFKYIDDAHLQGRHPRVQMAHSEKLSRRTLDQEEHYEELGNHLPPVEFDESALANSQDFFDAPPPKFTSKDTEGPIGRRLNDGARGTEQLCKLLLRPRLSKPLDVCSLFFLMSFQCLPGIHHLGRFLVMS